MTLPEVSSVTSIINQAKGWLPKKAIASWLARCAVSLDRETAIKAINKWTPEEARKLGFFRCTNSPHDGQIVYYEEHGDLENASGIYKILRCPACGHERHRQLRAYRQSPTPPYWQNRQ